MADHGGTLRLESTGSTTKNHAAAAPSRPVIPARHFHDCHDQKLAEKIDALTEAPSRPVTLAEIIDGLTEAPSRPAGHAGHIAKTKTGNTPSHHGKTSPAKDHTSTHGPAKQQHAAPHPPSSGVAAVGHHVKAAGGHAHVRSLPAADQQPLPSAPNRPQAKAPLTDKTPLADKAPPTDKAPATEPHVRYEDIKAKAAADEIKALRALSAVYAKDPHILDNNDSAWEPVVAVVTRANAPLQEETADLASPQAQTSAAIHLLNQATRNLDPRLAAEVVRLALPTYEKFHQAHMTALPDNALFGFLGTGPLVELTSRIAGTPHGDNAVARFAAIGGLHTGAVISALAAGAGPAYAIEFAHQLKADGIDPSSVYRVINDGMVQFRRQAVADAEADVEKLAEHNRELAWLADNDGAACSPEQFDKAVDGYTKSGDWKAQGETLFQHLSDRGVMLTHYMSTLKGTPPEAGCDDSIARTIETLTSDPATSLAISLAAKNNPALLRELESIAARFTSDTFRKSGEFVRKLTGEVASTILRKNVLEKLKNIDLSNPASVEMAKRDLESLRGFGRSNQDKVVQELKKTIDEMAKATSSTRDPVVLKAAQVAALKKLNDKLVGDPSIVKAFARDTLQGLLFRGFAVGLASLNLYNNARKFMDKGDVQSGVQAFAAGADLAHKGSEWLVGLGIVDKASAIGKFGGGWRLMGRASAGDLVSVISAGIEGFSGARSLFGWGVEQDTGSAMFSFASAAGSGLISAQAFGAAAWTGPVGVGVTAVALVGKEIYKDAKDAHKYEAASKKFLIAAGYKPEAAEALSKRGDYPGLAAGMGQMPFLAKYAEFKYAEFKEKMTPEGLRDWINGLSPDQVNNLSELVLFTLQQGDRLDGPDLSSQPRPQWAGKARTQGAAYGPSKALIVAVFDKMLEGRNVPHPSSPKGHFYH